MAHADQIRRDRGRPSFATVVVLAGVLAVLAGLLVGVGRAATSDRSAQAAAADPGAAAGGLTAQPVLGFPATGATIIGASAADSDNPGEVWAEGDVGPAPVTAGGGSESRQEVLVRRTNALGNWQAVAVDDGHGNALATGWTAAESTPAGAVVLAGALKGAAAAKSNAGILVQRSAGAGFSTVATTGVPSGETLSTADTGTPVLAADDEPDGTGLFAAPTTESAPGGSGGPNILHATVGASDVTWQPEDICASDAGGTCVAPSGAITVDAISASSPQHVWMVATPAAGDGFPQLYERVAGSDGQAAVWVARPNVAAGLPNAGTGFELPGAGTGAGATAPSSGALITASGDGVWLDLLGPGGSGAATVFVQTGGTVAGTWCTADLQCAGSTGTLPEAFPAGYGSVATTAAGSGSPGARVVTGLPHGAMMALDPGATSFAHRISIGGESETWDGTVTADDAGGNTVGPGGEAVAPGLRDQDADVVGGGAAFLGPTDAWIGIGAPTPGPEIAHLTPSPAPSALRSWPVPAQRPLLAIAGEPGQDAAGGQGQAVAVGAGGEVQRFTPSEGWSPETLTAADGSTATPTLRGVAWPTAGDAYAVGDGGAMWRWQATTGTWGPDPGAPPGLSADLTAVAFSSTDPSSGDAVGKGGTLLSFSAATGGWQSQSPPQGLEDADFSSVTFAGGEAIAAYRLPGAPGQETGGLIVDDGSGWRIDSTVASLFSGADVPASDTVLTKVAGLADGGAVAAGPGVVIERDSASAGWHFSATPLGELSGAGVSALGAGRDAGGAVRAIVSVDPDPTEDPNGANSGYPQADAGAAPAPDPEPNQGFVVSDTSTGWVDDELGDSPGVNEPAAGTPVDQPGWPDGVYALLVDPSGQSGWAVGGQTGGTRAQLLTGSSDDQATLADALDGSTARLGPGGPTPPTGSGGAIIPGPAENADDLTYPFPTIAVGGGPGCNAPCADDAEQGLGTDADLAQAIDEASQIPKARAFVDVGREIGWTAGSGQGADVFARELGRYGSVLSGGPPDFPVYATPNGPAGGHGGDIQSAGGEAIFQQALGDHDPTGSGSAGPAPPAGTDAYAFDSHGTGGALRVIVLDFSQGNSAASQETWLASDIEQARGLGEQVIVVGADSITNPKASNYAADAPQILAELEGHACGYIFRTDGGTDTSDFLTPPEGGTFDVFGVGTLGNGQAGRGDATAGGFSAFTIILGKGFIGPTGLGKLFPVGGGAPTVGQVSLAGIAGYTMPSSRTQRFPGIVDRVAGGAGGLGTRDPSFAAPADGGIVSSPGVSFSSSNPAVGDFILSDPKNPDNPYVIDNKVAPDSGDDLFCAFAPGTTTLTLNAGGQTYTETLTVTQGSGGPCPKTASTPLTAPSPAPAPAPTPTPAPAPAPPQPRPHPHPVTPHPSPAPIHPQHHPAPHHPAPAHHAAAHHPQPPAPVHHRPAPAPHPKPSAPAPSRPPAPVPAPKAPPSNPAPARPVPPPGASAGVSANVPGSVPSSVPGSVPVSSPSAVPGNVAAVQRRSSAEAAVEEARQSFAAYRPPRSGLGPLSLGLLGLAIAGAGSSGIVVRRRSRRAAPGWVRGAQRTAGRSR